MRALIQRVAEASVSVDRTSATTGKGFVILLGVKEGDTDAAALYLADKCAALRIMEDRAGKMNLSLAETGGEALVVSQFTLYGDARKGNRPSFTDAARPEEAERLYLLFVERLRATLGPDRVRTGVFGAMMTVTIVNDGPVTILLESPPPTQPKGD